MFCPKCGAQLREGAKFCGGCGAPVPVSEAPESQPETAAASDTPISQETAAAQAPETAQAPAAPASEPGAAPEGPAPILRRSKSVLEKQQAAGAQSVPDAPGEPILGKRRHGAGLIVGLAAAAVAVVALLALFVAPAVVRMVSPKAYLATCAANTMEAYTAAMEKTGKSLGLHGLSDALESKRMEAALDVSLSSVPGVAELTGAGFTLKSQMDLKDREAAYNLGVQYGTVSLGSMQVYMKDDLIAAGSTEFTGGKFYGVHTETLGGDILASEWGASAGVNQDLSFNLFDTMALYQKPQDILAPQTYAALKKETAELIGDAEIEKLGKKDMTVNGQRESLKLYAIELESEDLAEYIADCTEWILGDENLYQAMEPTLTAQAAQQGVDPSTLYEQMVAQATAQLNSDVLEMQLAGIRTRLELGTRGKQIAYGQLTVTGVAGAQPMAVALELGTGDSLVNDLTVTMTSGGAPVFSLRSTGNHEGKDGAFTDQTTLVAQGSPAMTMSTNFKSKEKANNFSFSLQAEDVNLMMNGSVEASSSKLSAQLDQVTLSAEGQTLGLSADYTLAPCKKFDFNGQDARLVTDMSLSELRTLEQEVTANAQSTIMGLLYSTSGLF